MSRRAKQKRGRESAAKGRRLEEEFARWMRKKMGYRKTTLGVRAKGKITERYYDVDIHGLKGGLDWTVLHLIGYVFLLLFAGTVALQFEPVKTWYPDMAAAIKLQPTGLLLFVIGGLSIILGRTRKKTHAWVECKNLSSNVKRINIVKLQAAAEDVKNARKTAFKPDVLIFVGANGFDKDALNFAREYDIQCYEKRGDAFVRVQRDD